MVVSFRDVCFAFRFFLGFQHAMTHPKPFQGFCSCDSSFSSVTADFSKWYDVAILNQGKENLKKIRNNQKSQTFKWIQGQVKFKCFWVRFIRVSFVSVNFKKEWSTKTFRKPNSPLALVPFPLWKTKLGDGSLLPKRHTSDHLAILWKLLLPSPALRVQTPPVVLI